MTVTVATELNRVELELALSNGREIEVLHTATVPTRAEHSWLLTSKEKDHLGMQLANGTL